MCGLGKCADFEILFLKFLSPMLLIMPDNKPVNADFCIRIDFEKSSPNPERVFQTMTEMINAFQEFDAHLARTIDVKIEPILMLEDIESGSLKTWLSSLLKRVPDSAIENLDWKQVVGHYLVKSKHIVINWLDGKTEITDSQQIIDVQYEILEAAKETKINQMNSYAPIQPKLLVQSINDINTALKKLDKKDKAEFISENGTANFNLNLNIAPKTLEELITKETISSESTMILKVKKPDYLGDSMWEFHYDHVIRAKILHEEWVNDFQNRKIDVRPGDAIRARVRTIVRYGYDNTIVDTHYEILKVVEIIVSSQSKQGDFGL